MLCFEVKVNGKVVCTAGVGDFGILSAILSWVNTHPSSRQYEVDEKEQTETEDLFLSVGGMTSQEKGDNEHVRWLDQQPVLPGDEIVIRVLNQSTCDAPARRFRDDENEETDQDSTPS
jgi:hypothetical protein